MREIMRAHNCIIPRSLPATVSQSLQLDSYGALRHVRRVVHKRGRSV